MTRKYSKGAGNLNEAFDKEIEIIDVYKNRDLVDTITDPKKVKEITTSDRKLKTYLFKKYGHALNVLLKYADGTKKNFYLYDQTKNNPVVAKNKYSVNPPDEKDEKIASLENKLNQLLATMQQSQGSNNFMLVDVYKAQNEILRETLNDYRNELKELRTALITKTSDPPDEGGLDMATILELVNQLKNKKGA